MIRQLGSAQPKAGDEVRFDNGRYVLTFRSGQPAIFHKGEYLKAPWSSLKEKRDDQGRLYWVIDSTSPQATRAPSNLMVYTVHIGYKGESLTFKVPAASEGRAKNSAVGRLAKKLGLDIPIVWAELKKPSNSIKVSLS